MRSRRKDAGGRLLAAWGIAVIPNGLSASGVDLPDAWWWYVIRYGLSAVWLAALLVWLRWLWREHRTSRALGRRAA